MSAAQGSEWFQLAHSLYKKGHSDEEIILQLREKGAMESRLREILQQVKSSLSARRRSTGFICCGIGIFLLVIGCMFTLFLFNNGGNIRLVMYGLTSIGLVITLKGMVDLLGW
ncbi:MAG: hypothetical protein ACO25B_12210 [Chitinophagaceae bacterium]